MQYRYFKFNPRLTMGLPLYGAVAFEYFRQCVDNGRVFYWGRGDKWTLAKNYFISPELKEPLLYYQDASVASVSGIEIDELDLLLESL